MLKQKVQHHVMLKKNATACNATSSNAKRVKKVESSYDKESDSRKGKIENNKIKNDETVDFQKSNIVNLIMIGLGMALSALDGMIIIGVKIVRQSKK